MPDYHFKSLSSFDFETLVRDLLQLEIGVRLETFKSGRDQGIDLRYQTDEQSSLVVQCKHFANTPYSTFLSGLRNKELPKVAVLQPQRYILATSLGLTPANKDELQKLFLPFCLTTGDIFGREDINNLLGKYPEVERRQFKLWLTSEAVLERVLHSDVFNQTQADLEKIRRKLRYYVRNESVGEALEILSKHHYCVITGIPGIGKTTLAEMLLIYHLCQGYTAYAITSDIGEAFRIYRPQEKQVFYYDDFLGQTSLEHKFGKNEDKNLLRFIEMVGNSPNKRLILTTREYILNQAKFIYERIANSEFDLRRCVIDLASYTEFTRAQILYNHVFFSDLPEECRTNLVKDRSYRRIIGHLNFNPRIIEWMTSYAKQMEMDCENYITTFMANLDDPSKLWEHAFDHQLSDVARCLLLVMASLPAEVSLKHLEAGFTAFYESASRHYSYKISARDFERALKELDGNFICTEQKWGRIVVRFHNPSIRDFLQMRMAGTPSYIQELGAAAVYFQQLVTLWEMRSYSVKDLTGCQRTTSVRELMAAKPDELMRNLARTISSENCGPVSIHYDTPQGRVLSERFGYPLEARLLFVIEVVKRLYRGNAADQFKNFFMSVSDILSGDLEDIWGDRELLLSLTLQLKKHRFDLGIHEHPFFESVKGFLGNDFDTVNDFVCWADFEEAYPERITVIERWQVRSAAKDLNNKQAAELISQLSNDSPEEIREYASMLENVSERLGVDVSKMLAELDKAAADMERETAAEESEGEGEIKYKQTETRVIAGEDIDLLFETLLTSEQA